MRDEFLSMLSSAEHRQPLGLHHALAVFETTSDGIRYVSFILVPPVSNGGKPSSRSMRPDDHIYL